MVTLTVTTPNCRKLLLLLVGMVEAIKPLDNDKKIVIVIIIIITELCNRRSSE